MKRLRSRIIRLFETGTIADDDDGGGGKRQKLEYLVKTKKWYPYTVYVYTPHCDYAIIFTSTKNIGAIKQIVENTS